MIPVIGILHYQNVILTENCLRTIPEDVYERMVIVDNSAGRSAPTFAPRSSIISLGRNMGVAHGWNTIIKATPDALWWAIFGSDLEFIRSDFERLETAMMSHALVKMNGYEAFALRREVVKTVGWFDEDFHPAYCEDNDYQRRADLAGIDSAWIEPPFRHVGSATIAGNEWARQYNDKTYPQNIELYMAKWGGLMHNEVHTTPYDGRASPAIGGPDIDRLSRQRWREPGE